LISQAFHPFLPLGNTTYLPEWSSFVVARNIHVVVGLNQNGLRLNIILILILQLNIHIAQSFQSSPSNY
jgi:hypothetical protein